MKRLDKGNIEDIIALTPMQEGMLFHYLKDPTGPQYFEQLCLSLSGEMDFECVEKAWNVVIETNEMLRTRFRWEKVKNPIQIVLKECALKPIHYDFSGEAGNKKEQLKEEIKARDREEKFDLNNVPFRVALCKMSENEYEMIISNHHILYDGWSSGIILKEFFDAYDKLFKREKLQLPVKTKYKSFVKWLQTRDTKTQEKFWKDYLEGFNTPTILSIKSKKKKDITAEI